MLENWRWTTGRVCPEQSNGWTFTGAFPFAFPDPLPLPLMTPAAGAPPDKPLLPLG